MANSSLEGFIIKGIAAGDVSGYSVSSAGDINGDGIDDLLVGSNGASPNGLLNAGKSYVIFGRAGQGFQKTINLSDLNGANGFSISGIAAGDQLGASVNKAGDVNGDGIDDIVIGASRSDPNGESSGSSFVVFGKRTPFANNLNVSTLNGSNGFAIKGISADDRLGAAVSGAGDVNGDGIGDIIVGARFADPNGVSSGQSYVVFGSSKGFAASLDPSTLNGSNGFKVNGINADDRSGYSVSAAGDVNGDGIDDIIVGAYFADPNGKNESGQSYVVFGKRGGFSSNFELSTLDGNNGFILNGVAAGDRSGITVGKTGDINGDGIGDIIVGAYFAGPSGSISGQSYVVFGKRSGFNRTLELSALNGTNGFTINGAAAGDISGIDVGSAGDVNGDGIDDIIVGAAYASPNGVERAGQSYIVFGNRNGFGSTLELSALNGINGFKINGFVAGSISGLAASGAGDINGDGIDDIIVGAPYGRPNNPFPGESYVIFGRVGLGSSGTFELSQLVDTPPGSGTTGNDSLTGTAGNDQFIGGGGNDTINGGAGNDSVSYAAIGGPITLKATGIVTKSTGGTDQLISIESITGSFGAGDRIDAFTPASTASIVANLTTGSFIVNGATPSPLTFTVSNFENVTGTANNDVITGNLTDNVLDGGAGNDTLFGSGGNDIINGGVGNDSVSYASISGPITLKATGIVDKSTGGTDQLVAVETITASAGAGDKINAFVPSGTASIVANLSTGSLIIRGIPTTPSTFAISNFEDVTGTINDDIITGSNGNNVLDGGAGKDLFIGSGGNDTIIGDGIGNDAINYLDLTGPISVKAEIGSTGLTTVVTKSTGGIDRLTNITNITASSFGGDRIDAFTIAGASTTSIVANLTTGSLDVIGFAATPLSFSIDSFENVTGTDNNDTITGNLASNVLEGGAGNDNLFGTGGSDTLNGGTGNDTVSYASIGGPITLKPTGIVEKSTGGVDQLTKVETIVASTGNGDKIDASAPSGQASIVANLTTGSLIVSGATASPLSFAVSNFENVTGTINNDSITGNSADNILDGGGGEDRFFGSGGNDTIIGDILNDSVSYIGSGGFVTLRAEIVGDGLTEVVTKSAGGTDRLVNIGNITGGAGTGDKIDAFTPSSTSFIVADLAKGSFTIIGFGPTPLDFVIDEFENISGTLNNDSITGNRADNVLEGISGNDKFFGSGGNDTIDGGVGNDSVSYAVIGGPITLKATGVVAKSTGGTDKLVSIETITASTEAKDKIDASTSSGAASIVANLTTKSLVVNGATSAALSFTVENFEDVIGTINDDIIIGDAGDNFLDGGAGNDNLSGSAGNDNLSGGAGNDNLSGGVGNDNLSGGVGNDTIDGGVGNDTINGGVGADQLRGGAGNNVFGFQFGQSLSTGADRILDFAIGTDKIELFSAAGIAASVPIGLTRAANNSSATTLAALAAAVYTDSNGALSGNQALGAGSAALVVSTNAGIAGTYLFIDNGTNGFQSNNDLVINITGSTGALPALGKVSVNSFFI